MPSLPIIARSLLAPSALAIQALHVRLWLGFNASAHTQHAALLESRPQPPHVHDDYIAHTPSPEL